MWSSSIHLLVLIQPVLMPLFQTSIFTKNQEFYTWLVEERKINPETVSKEQQKKEFSRFVEDYNTGMSTASSSPSSHLIPFSYIIPREVLQHGGLRETYVSTQTRRILTTRK